MTTHTYAALRGHVINLHQFDCEKCAAASEFAPVRTVLFGDDGLAAVTYECGHWISLV